MHASCHSLCSRNSHIGGSSVVSCRFSSFLCSLLIARASKRCGITPPALRAPLGANRPVRLCCPFIFVKMFTCHRAGDIRNSRRRPHNVASHPSVCRRGNQAGVYRAMYMLKCCKADFGRMFPTSGRWTRLNKSRFRAPAQTAGRGTILEYG